MKVYISSDMEGSTGVVSWNQVTQGSDEYGFGRAMQEHDTLAAARAALECGADTVMVNDSHDSMTNLDVRAFPENVRVISGTPKILGMVEGAAGCDTAMFIGYHAMAGTEKAVLDHTYCSRTIYSMKINGKLYGETGLNAIFCGALGVPVSLVTGDSAVCLEASSLLGPGLETCAVKDGTGRYNAETLTPEASGKLISEAVRKAIDNAKNGKSPLLKAESPYEMEITFLTTAQTDSAGLIPGSERTSGRSLVYRNNDVFELRRWLYSCMTLAAASPF